MIVALLSRLFRGLFFLGFFLWELTLANVEVAVEVLTPRHRMRPGIIKIPLRSRTDVEITLLANFISLTPGTLTLEVDEENRALYVHGMSVKDPADFRRKVHRLEDHLLKVIR